MANSRYEYVKSFELDDQVMLPNLMVVRIDGRDFSRFSQVHEFEKPNDETALNLMNSCSAAVLEEFPDIIFAYGYSDEYSFVFKKTSRFYQRRASKILSLVASFFPRRRLQYAPSYSSKVISCASAEVLQAYLAWRQQDCHVNNQYDTCLWMLVKSGKSISETQKVLKDTQKQQKNELLFQNFGYIGNDVSLSEYKGKTLLIVNVASKCGLTDANYKELNVLYEKYKDQGLEILAFPCNQFLGQEPGNDQEIQQTVCTKFKAEFPILDKVDVNGKNTAPLYKYLKAEKGGLLIDAIKWNFTKFLVSPDGKVSQRYSPRTSLLQFEKDIQTLLGQQLSS